MCDYTRVIMNPPAGVAVAMRGSDRITAEELYMKKWIIVLMIMASPVMASAAQNSGPFGLGLILGDPTGITAKYWLGNQNAIDGSIGFHDLSIQADYLWHFNNIFPKVREGAFLAYTGIGFKIEDKDHHHDGNHDDNDLSAGIRVPLGVAFELGQHPLEFFIELAPTLEFTPDTDMNLDGSIGARYFF